MMNSALPHLPSHFGSFIPIDNGIWCESDYSQNIYSNDQHCLQDKFCKESSLLHSSGMRKSCDSDYTLKQNDPTNKYEAGTIEYQSTKDYESTTSFFPFNGSEGDDHGEACSPRVLEIETFSLTDQFIFQNEAAKGATMGLGEDFVPSNYNVICGRGKRAYNHIGNRRFKLTIAMNLRKYIDTNNLSEKSDLIDSIIHQIREASGSTKGTGFLKEDAEGNWYDVGVAEAREKTARAFRDYSTTGSLRKKCRSVGQTSFCDDESNKKIIQIQNSIFESCQVKFSGQ